MGKGVPGETEEELRKAALRTAFNRSIRRSGQAVRGVARPLREVRYPANPRAAKPISMVAQVDGSGMATITPSSAPIP